jgi:hypothetical protein
MNPIDPQFDLEPIVDTLATKFGSVVDRHQINDLVTNAAAQFVSAPIRDYVPILVQHLCADRLRELASAGV